MKRAKLTAWVKPHNINLRGYRTAFFSNYDFKSVAEDQAFYQFGVFSGKSMIEMLDIFKDKNTPMSQVYGFDSFQGIPECSEEPLHFNVWAEGEFNSCDYLDVDDPSVAAKIICEEVKQSLYSEDQKITFYEGFFKDTLPKIDAAKLLPAAFVDIDTDIYSSARDALFFLASNNLIKVGTIINYDDWGSPNSDTFSDGESRAHREMCEEYNIQCSLIRQTTGQRAYEVIKV
jgi:hypothetical protein